MGIKLVVHVKNQLRVDFTDTAMIGRQQLCVTPEELRQLLGEMQVPVTDEQLARIIPKKYDFAEEFLKLFGAKEVHSLDVSDYEKATHLVDMNQPIPEELKEKYSLVFDSGSLEHVFNFPTAIRNCMEMVKPGGHYFSITPANNYFGHGFYQFSPELFFTIFAPENGFEVTQMIVYEDVSDAQCFQVRSPEEVQGRVTMTSAVPVYICIVARRTAVVPIFQKTPQQSDYVAVWDGVRQHNYPVAKEGFKQFAQKYLPVLIRLRKAIWPETAFANRTLFVPIELAKGSPGSK